MVVSLSCYFMLLVGCLCFFKLSSHILMMLLNLELLSLIILLMMVEFLSLFSYDLTVIIYLIIIMVCEAVIGLVLLTLYIRTHGSDYLKSLTLLMC
uniref:NADH-ubiquinone oxidoreductase chain 4L n=1 Tax=Pariaconus pele TaxID=1950172 RepID=A0A344A2N0_9HEMI|nr:NADH dehydrogenase subunit 4L [Pariaconus pele]AWU49021.1 NADH dehydrogenase subunit 4L [Pariaconus pele]